MTVTCPTFPFTSSPKPGLQADLVDLTGGVGLLSAFPNLGWLQAVAAVLGTVSYHLPTFCATDPPGFPTFTAAEILAFSLNQGGPDYLSFLSKAQATLATIVWYQSCQCDSGTTPPVPTPPVAPTTAPTVVTTTQRTNAPCFSQVYGPKLAAVYPPAVGTPVAPPYAAGSPPQLDFLGTYNGGFGGWCFGVLFPSGAYSYTLTFSFAHTGGTPGTQWEWEVRKTTISNLLQTQEGFIPGFIQAPSAAPLVQNYQVDPGQVGVQVIGYSRDSTTYTPSVQLDVNCNAPGVQGGSGCCPPDPSLMLMLQRINTSVTLIQRQIAPFAYVTSTAHAGLSGNGQFAVQGLIGLAVSLTTVPSAVGAQIGDPLNLFGAGWVNVGTTDGWGPRQRITSNPFIFKPVSGDVTLVGYSLAPGVVATITELIREP